MDLSQNYILESMDHDNICQLPYDNDANKLAVHVRRTNKLTGKILVKRNVMREAHRLQIDIQNINLIVNRIWNHHLTPTQQEEFTTLANDANIINQNAARETDSFLNRMIRIDIYQASNNPFEDALFNGTKEFYNKNDFESLILTSGSSF